MKLTRVWNRAATSAADPLTRPNSSTSAAWYRISNLAAGATDLWIYDEIGAWGTPATDLVKDLAAIRGSGPINLHINSPGGEVFDGIAIYNALRAHAAPIHVTIDGLAASIATVIAMAGDTVKIAPNATMMIHEAHMIAVGSASEMTKAAASLERCSDNIASIYADRSGVPAATWRARMQSETWYTADEAVAAGLADEVLAKAGPVPGAPKPAAAWDLSVYNYAGRDVAPAPDVARSIDLPTSVANEGSPPPVAPPTSPPIVAFDPAEVMAAFGGFSAAVRSVTQAPDLTFDPDVFRSAMQSAATSAAAPPAPKPTAPSAPEASFFGFDPAEFNRAIREGRK